MKLTLAVLALINATEARHHLGRRSDVTNIQVGVRFVEGVNDFRYGIPNSLVQASSDPIHGSLGPPKVDPADLNPAQQFELKQRNTPKPVFVDDPEQVVDTLDSIKTAEELTGGTLEYKDPEQMKKKNAIRDDAKYPLADSDDETEDTVETRRSIQFAENALKTRWFINAGEKRSFEEKTSKGQIRPEVLEFRDSSDADPQDSAETVGKKETDKKAALIKAAEEKKEADTDAAAAEKEGKHWDEETKCWLKDDHHGESIKDDAAKQAAAKSLEDQDKIATDAAKVKKEGKPAEGSGDDGSAKKEEEKKAGSIKDE